jgi:hypothetical protein
VKLHAIQTANAERRESVVVLQASELALHRTASTVEVAEALRVARDAREQTTAKRERHHRLLASATERDDGFAATLLTLRVHARVVVFGRTVGTASQASRARATSGAASTAAAPPSSASSAA